MTKKKMLSLKAGHTVWVWRPVGEIFFGDGDVHISRTKVLGFKFGYLLTTQYGPHKLFCNFQIGETKKEARLLYLKWYLDYIKAKIKGLQDYIGGLEIALDGKKEECQLLVEKRKKLNGDIATLKDMMNA